MRIFRCISFLFLLVPAGNLLAQNSLYHTLRFRPVFGQSVLIPGEAYYKVNLVDSVQIRTLKFYISNIELRKADATVWKEAKSYHLVNAAVEQSLDILLNDDTALITYDEIRFDLGIDSITNTAGVLGGPLDPTNGMYWTWQSGYINFKLEGTSNLCVTRNNEFQFHLGGYRAPFSTLQTVACHNIQGPETIVELDLEKLFTNIHLSITNQIMSPGTEAVSLSKQIASIFKVK